MQTAQNNNNAKRRIGSIANENPMIFGEKQSTQKGKRLLTGYMFILSSVRLINLIVCFCLVVLVMFYAVCVDLFLPYVLYNLYKNVSVP